MYTCFFNSSIYDKSIFRKAALTSAIQKSLKWLWLTSQIWQMLRLIVFLFANNSCSFVFFFSWNVKIVSYGEIFSLPIRVTTYWFHLKKTDSKKMEDLKIFLWTILICNLSQIDLLAIFWQVYQCVTDYRRLSKWYSVLMCKASIVSGSWFLV